MSGRILARAARPLLAAAASILILFTLPACDSGGSDDVAGPEHRRGARRRHRHRHGHQPAACDRVPRTCGPLDWTPGAPVLLIATPIAPSTFTGWSGAVTSTDDTVRIVVTGHVVVTATFGI